MPWKRILLSWKMDLPGWPLPQAWLLSQPFISALLGQDAHIIATDSLYSASRVVLETELSRFGVKSTFVDTSDLRNIEQALQPQTRMIYIETPANPTMKITDIRGAAEIAHGHGAFLVVR